MINRALLKVVLAVLVFALVVHEAVAIAVNYVQLDGISGEAVRAGATVSAGERTEAHVERAVLAALDEHPAARLEHLAMDREALEITVARTARVLVLDRLGPLEGWADNAVSKQARFR